MTTVKEEFLEEKEELLKNHMVNHAHYWANIEKNEPLFDIYIASTNEPNLEESLRAWQLQGLTDFRLNVVIDCIENETYDIVKKFSKDKRFRFTISPVMQGLCHIWNQALLSKSKYIVLAGADIVHPVEYLVVCNTVLGTHPEYGWVQPVTVSQPEDFPLWSYAITKDCANKTGLFDPAFGLGGMGMIRDWQVRAYDAGFRAKSLWNVRTKASSYSIMDKVADLSLIEGDDTFKKKYGINIVNTSNIQIRPYPDFVDNKGIVIDVKNGEIDSTTEIMNAAEAIRNEIKSIADEITTTWKSATVTHGARIADGFMLYELERRCIDGVAAGLLVVDFWTNHVRPGQEDAMKEQLGSVDIAMSRILDLLVRNRCSKMYTVGGVDVNQN